MGEHLLNYTTTVDVNRTVMQVTQILVRAGARTILTAYRHDGRPCGLSFTVDTPLGARRFVLPVNAERVWKVMQEDRKLERRYRTEDQAERVAWRIIKDWLEAQLAIIATEMVSLDQVLLPYMTADDGRTVYDLYLERALPELGRPE